jgi:hypothetical protein
MIWEPGPRGSTTNRQLTAMAATPKHLLQIEAQIKAMVDRKSRELDERLARCAAELGYKPTGNPDCPYA